MSQSEAPQAVLPFLPVDVELIYVAEGVVVYLILPFLQATISTGLHTYSDSRNLGVLADLDAWIT